MFTQFGLENIWREAKSGVFSSCADVEITCDSAQERCLKIYMHSERRYFYFSSMRLSQQSPQPFSVWVRSNQWEPQSQVLSSRHTMTEFAQKLPDRAAA